MLSLQQLGQEEALPRSSFFLSFNAYIFYLIFFYLLSAGWQKGTMIQNDSLSLTYFA